VAHTETVVDSLRFRRVLGHFCTGVTVVTSADEAGPVGFACQAFAALSMDPPLVLFCPGTRSSTWRRIARAGHFCVNVLAEDQLDICLAFASSGGDKFAGLTWHDTPWGPSIENVLATVHCDIEAVHPAGDHDVVIGHVRELVTHREAAPLLFFRGQFGLDS